jgi:hypothetical protein
MIGFHCHRVLYFFFCAFFVVMIILFLMGVFRLHYG